MVKKLTIFARKWHVLLAILSAFLIIFSRRPDAILNPQFWAEDGRNWYADAYNHGLFYSLTTPEAGYYQSFSRIVGNIAQLFPLSFGPSIFNAFAIAVQITVFLFILSPRLKHLIPNAKLRLAAAVIYLLVPHSAEVFVNVTNSQWHLALLCFLIIIASKPKTKAWKIFDISVFVISAASGPVCILLIPIVVLKYFYRREKWLIPLGAILAAGTALQIYGLLTSVRPIQTNLGAKAELLAHIAARHLFASPIIGGFGYKLIEKSGDAELIIVVIIALLGFGLTAYAFVRSNLELRLFIIFSVLIIAAALYSPAVTADPGQWKVIANYNTALRYWFIPNLALFATLGYLSRQAPVKFIKYTATVLLMISAIGIALDWRQPQLADKRFYEHAAEFEKAPSGTVVAIPINPDWEMRLVKK